MRGLGSVAWFGVCVALVSCGRDDTAARARVARLAVSTASQLVAGPDGVAQLTAVAWDADGEVVRGAPVRWRSEDPTVVSVDATGLVRGRTRAGSTYVVAESGEVSSAPVLVWVAGVPDGALLFDDSQILEGPTLTSSGSLLPGARYAVTLADVGLPEPGTIVLARQQAPVAGRVVSALDQGDGVALELEVVGLPELFVDVDLELIDEVPVVPDAAREFEVAGFTCQTASEVQWPTPTLVAALGNGLTVEREVTLAQRGGVPEHVRVALTGTLRLDASGSVDLPLQWGGTLGCTKELSTLQFPFPGPLALVLATKVPLGVGFDVQAKTETAPVGIQADGFVAAEVIAGFEYTAEHGFQELSTLTPSHALRLRWHGVDLSQDLTLQGSLFLFLSAGLDIGHPLAETFGLPDIALAELKAGVKGEVALTRPIDQIQDPTDASSYRVATHAELKAGEDYEKVLRLFGIEAVTIEMDPPDDAALLRSPQGTSAASTADVREGEPVTLTTTLDPATVDFTEGYNVEAIQIWRHDDDDGWEPFAEIPAESDGQTVFEHTWTPTAEDEADGADFAWTVETLELPGVPLEIEPDSRAEVGGEALSVRVGGGTVRYLTTECAADQLPSDAEAPLVWNNGCGTFTVTSTGRQVTAAFDVDAATNVGQIWLLFALTRPGTLTAEVTGAGTQALECRPDSGEVWRDLPAGTDVFTNAPYDEDQGAHLYHDPPGASGTRLEWHSEPGTGSCRYSFFTISDSAGNLTVSFTPDP